MRNLDAINPPFARPSSLISLGAMLPLLLSLCCTALPIGAAPDVAVADNPIALFCLAICVVSAVMVAIPRMFKWDWRAGYFGVTGFYLLSMALTGLIPLLCVLVYGGAPVLVKILLLAINTAILVWWGWRCVPMYRKIFANSEMRDKIYHEDTDCFYYYKQGDRMVLDKVFKFSDFPSAAVIVLSFALAFGMMFYARALVAFLGVPIPHIFLLSAAISLEMIGVGAAVRGWMIYYHYPRQLKRQTGKMVYVDMVTKSSKVDLPKAMG